MSEISTTIFELNDQQVEDAFVKYVKAKFPFAAKLKAVAERFGALPRGKAMSPQRQSGLTGFFEDTLIYEETLREAMLEKADLNKVKQIIWEINENKITYSTLIRSEKPTPLDII